MRNIIKIVRRSAFVTTILFLFASCQPHSNQGMWLEKFDIVDSRLSEIADSVMDMFIDCDGRIKILDIEKVDSFLLFKFAYINKSDLMDLHVHLYNKRILGYGKIKEEDMVIMTNIDDKHLLVRTLCNLLRPTEEHKDFPFIKPVRDSFYSDDSKYNNWTYPIVIYDPTYILYIYDNGVFANGVIVTNALEYFFEWYNKKYHAKREYRYDYNVK